MSSGAVFSPELVGSPEPPVRSGWQHRFCQWENLLLVIPLVLMLLMPVAEIILRTVFKTGISGSSAIVQHLTLIVGMLGGAIAARDRRLLALSPVQTLLHGRARTAAQIFSSGFAAAITFFLFLASLQYVLGMRPLGKILVYGIPVWVVQLILPIGFGLVLLRLVWNASEKYGGRALALALGAAAVGVAIWAPGSPERLMIPALVGLAVATLLGAPVFTALGGAALILFWGHELPIQAVPLKHYSLTTNNMLPSIPIFTLAGYFLAEGGASQRLVRVFQAMVGQFRGGPAIVTALVCVRGDDSGARRRAHASPAGGAVFGAQRARLADRRRVARHVVSPLPAADSLHHRRQP
jgi:C4-dicarboxylate transporter DctM subunit